MKKYVGAVPRKLYQLAIAAEIDHFENYHAVGKNTDHFRLRGTQKTTKLNCVSELISRSAVFRFVFRAHDELDALVGCVAKFRTLRVQRIQPERLTRREHEIRTGKLQIG